MALKSLSLYPARPMARTMLSIVFSVTLFLNARSENSLADSNIIVKKKEEQTTLLRATAASKNSKLQHNDGNESQNQGNTSSFLADEVENFESQHRTLAAADGSGCCSYDLKTCDATNNWCNSSASNCLGSCNGVEYIEWERASSTCTARWAGCSSSDECCGIGACIQFSWGKACGIPSDGSEIGTCCSWSEKDCGIPNEPNHWCNQDETKCTVDCSGSSYLDPYYRGDTCTARWKYCISNEECCGLNMTCMPFYWGANACGLPGDNETDPPSPSPVGESAQPSAKPSASPSVSSENPSDSPSKSPVNSPIAPITSDEVGNCCSWDVSSCSYSSEWCDESKGNCEDGCNGYYIDPSHSNRSTCTARWQYCTTDTECCLDADGNEVLKCINYDWGVGCGLPQDDVGGPNTPAPVPVSTAAPVPGPTSAPVPGPTSAPVPGPTSAPVPLPTSAPIPLPTSTAAPVPSPPTGTIPGGPYVTFDKSSAKVIIPQPPIPSDLGGSQTGCPHLESGLLDWNDAATWSGSSPPSGGQPVTLPINSRVLLSSTESALLGLITIPPSSELIIGESAAGIELRTSGILVEGKLTAGSESCRINTPIAIVLHGTRPFAAAVTGSSPSPEVKGISVRGGTISLHGKRYYRTWTRLAKTVDVGEDVLLLQDEVNWEAGQEIVLVTTAMKDSREWHQNEVLTIASVTQDPVPGSGVGSAIFLTSGVQNKHLALENAYQAEVGLLTRTIKVEGATSDSLATDPDPLDCKDRWLFGNNDEPCPNTELTGYGGHIMVHQGGKGYVEGVELFQMGQTNVLGRYPMHFHLLNNGCSDCYFKDSSVHKSFYRCISIHGTNGIEASENVAFDVIGYCYYLEDGVEENNTFSYNLGAHIHLLGPEAPWGHGQTTALYQQSSTLTLPADVTASAFYITNINNNVVGNAASGGWSGFAFPNLPEPLGPHRGDPNYNMRPSSALPLNLDGNTAHSTGWWWYHAGAFYFGGALYYNSGDVLEYNAGRDFNFQRHGRTTCNVDLCAQGNCDNWCPEHEKLWVPLKNSKAYLVPANGLNSWTGRMELLGFETHDVGLTLEALSDGFWIDNAYAECRTNVPLALPPGARADSIAADGFGWYDTAQEHIVTNSEFKNCGYRSNEFDQYDTSPSRGCASGDVTGCRSNSAVFSFLTHSDQFNPEIMQATKNIVFTDCGRRFKMTDFRNEATRATSVSSRIQNWLDADGSVTGLGVPSVIASGLPETGAWWTVDDDVVQDPQAPSQFISLTNGGPDRDVGHVTLAFDAAQHNQVGGSVCSNGNVNIPCVALGYMRHLGPKFASEPGLPVTAAADVAGMIGGFGWLLTLNEGAPKKLDIDMVEVKPDSPLLMSVQYPLGTSFVITYKAAWCSDNSSYYCNEVFTSVSSRDAVRASLGNTYHFDATTGLLTFRVIQTAQTFIGYGPGNSSPGFIKPDYNTVGKWGSGYALNRFERDGIILPTVSYGPELTIEASCAVKSSNNAYCSGSLPSVNLDATICPSGYSTQTAYDTCCTDASATSCIYADGGTS